MPEPEYSEVEQDVIGSSLPPFNYPYYPSFAPNYPFNPYQAQQYGYTHLFPPIGPGPNPNASMLGYQAPIYPAYPPQKANKQCHVACK